MLGGTEPEATCAEMKETVDRQMGRTGATERGGLRNARRRRPTSSTSDEHRLVRVVDSLARACSPWNPSYPADSDLRYRVHLEFRFQPVVPFVGFLTGNGMGGSLRSGSRTALRPRRVRGLLR